VPVYPPTKMVARLFSLQLGFNHLPLIHSRRLRKAGAKLSQEGQGSVGLQLHFYLFHFHFKNLRPGNIYIHVLQPWSETYRTERDRGRKDWNNLKWANLIPLHELSISVYLSVSIYMVLQSVVGPCPLFSFLIFYTVGRTPWTGDQPVVRPLLAHRRAQTWNKRTETSIPQVGFEPTIAVFERLKTVHALDRAALWSALHEIKTEKYLRSRSKSMKWNLPKRQWSERREFA
jgi:hypothetical protein